MELELYVIYDAAENRYGIPMAQANDQVAMRSFAHECMKTDSMWNSHPQDFTMYKVGTYDVNYGTISAYNPIERVCSATDFVRKEK